MDPVGDRFAELAKIQQDAYVSASLQSELFTLQKLVMHLQSEIVASIKNLVGEEWLATCFDVAEHMDIEHLSNFLRNLHLLVNKYGLISISTRPSIGS